ncbi:hypothetical protein FACS189421_12200 [Bacteroidia bacterium]|nr:hypothetical protein FACS189421_12200 [Bacteroidia bacterium]
MIVCRRDSDCGSPAGKFGGVFEDRLDLFIKLREELGDKEDSFEPKKIPENTIAAERERLERINELREAQSHTHRQWAYYNRMYACD